MTALTDVEPPVAEPVALGPTGSAPAGGAPRRGRLRGLASQVLPPILVLVGLIGLWYFLSYRLPEHRRFLLPYPHEVVKVGVLDGETFSEIMASMWLTTRLALTGLALAILLGMALGILMHRFRPVERAAYPYLVALQAVPILAITPLMIIAFGSGATSKTIVCVIIAFFPIPTNLLLGMKSVDRGMLDLFSLHGATWRTQLRRLSLPASMPALFTGFRISAGLAVIGAIVGELFFQQGEPGLGLRLVQYRQRLMYEQLYSCLIWSSLLGIAVFLFFGWLGHRVVRSWHESAA
jgi:NitT/TauT family transport system permease protein